MKTGYISILLLPDFNINHLFHLLVYMSTEKSVKDLNLS